MIEQEPNIKSNSVIKTEFVNIIFFTYFNLKNRNWFAPDWKMYVLLNILTQKTRWKQLFKTCIKSKYEIVANLYRFSEKISTYKSSIPKTFLKFCTEGLKNLAVKIDSLDRSSL